MARTDEMTKGRRAARRGGAEREAEPIAADAPRAAFTAGRDPALEHRLGHELDWELSHGALDADYDVGMGEPIRPPRPRIRRLRDALASSSRRAVRRMRELPRDIPRPAPRTLGALAVIAALSAAAAMAGARAYPADRWSRSGRWYRMLDRAPFHPPDRVFGLVWSVLYSLGAASAFRLWRAPGDRAPRTRKAALALWATQLGLGAAWTPTFFGARKPRLALAEVCAMVAATGGYAMLARRVDRPAAMLIAPSLAWAAFAGVLNEEIVRRNA